MTDPLLAIKIDVDTDRGTRIGVPNLVALFDEFGVKATFLFSLGPDNTGRAIKRIFRPGFPEQGEPHQRGLHLRDPHAPERRASAGPACGQTK